MFSLNAVVISLIVIVAVILSGHSFGAYNAGV